MSKVSSLKLQIQLLLWNARCLLCVNGKVIFMRRVYREIHYPTAEAKCTPNNLP